MLKLTFAVTGGGERTRLAVTGEIDLANRESLISTALGALEDTTSLLEIELSDVTFCDSSGVSGLIAIHRIAANEGKRMVITNPQRQVERTLEIAGLLGLLTAPPAE
jgi:anti-anti-sigma factor